MADPTCFEQSVVIRCAPAAVHAELIEPHRFVGLQPLIVEVIPVAGGDPARQRVFEAVERIRFLGIFRWDNRIRVCIEGIRSGEVVEIEARSFPRVIVRARFTLTPEPSGTNVREEVAIRAPRLLRRFVASEAARVQATLLANLKQRLEARPSSS